MHRSLYTAIVSALLLASACAPRSEPAPTYGAPEVRAELLQMAQRDQQVRRGLLAKGLKNITAADVALQDSIDAVHRDRLKAIIERHGWPTPAMVGDDGVQAAFLIVQHSTRDVEFQQRMLPFIRESHAAGILDGEDVALLTDRILVRHGLPQRYGTQISIFEGQLEVAPLEDPQNVDALRAEMGMMPLEEYLQLLKKRYNIDE